MEGWETLRLCWGLTTDDFHKLIQIYDIILWTKNLPKNAPEYFDSSLEIRSLFSKPQSKHKQVKQVVLPGFYPKVGMVAPMFFFFSNFHVVFFNLRSWLKFLVVVATPVYPSRKLPPLRGLSKQNLQRDLKGNGAIRGEDRGGEVRTGGFRRVPALGVIKWRAKIEELTKHVLFFHPMCGSCVFFYLWGGGETGRSSELIASFWPTRSGCCLGCFKVECLVFGK